MRVQIKFVKEDGWVGVFYRRKTLPAINSMANVPHRIERQVFVCLVPFFPIIFSWVKPDPYYDCSGPGKHIGPWRHVQGSDSLQRCQACGLVIGK